MPDEPQGDPVAAPSRPRRPAPPDASEAPAAKPAQQRYPVSRLRSDPTILGASTPALAAAFADADVADDDMLTRDEAAELIAASQARSVDPQPEEA